MESPSGAEQALTHMRQRVRQGEHATAAHLPHDEHGRHPQREPLSGDERRRGGGGLRRAPAGQLRHAPAAIGARSRTRPGLRVAQASPGRTGNSATCAG